MGGVTFVMVTVDDHNGGTASRSFAWNTIQFGPPNTTAAPPLNPPVVTGITCLASGEARVFVDLDVPAAGRYDSEVFLSDDATGAGDRHRGLTAFDTTQPGLSTRTFRATLSGDYVSFTLTDPVTMQTSARSNFFAVPFCPPPTTTTTTTTTTVPPTTVPPPPPTITTTTTTLSLIHI